jgi:carbon monoxide dehydrogenase subunit G
VLKKILVALVVLIAAFAVFVAFLPSDFRVARSATIDAPPAAVFEHVNDLHKWEPWSPWAKLDPNAKVAFEGPPAGKGAAMTWSGNDAVGEGRMTIADSRPDERVAIDVTFVRPFEGSSTSEFAFKPEGEGTAVTWAMSGHQGYIEKAVCFLMNGQKMIGGEMDKGLSQLKAVAAAGR